MFTGLIVQDGTATGIPQSGTGSTSEGTQEDREQDTLTVNEDMCTDKERTITSSVRRGLSQVIQ